MKVFKICSSQNLPVAAERSDEYIYFCYDTLEVYNGFSFHSDQYAIVESVPESNPVRNMFYFTFDGYVKIYTDNYEWEDIAFIEDESELIWLISAGTTFLMKSEYRYIDKQTRVMSVPYQNGSFQAVFSCPEDILIDDNTIIRYDTSKEEFVVDASLYVSDDDEGNFSSYKGGETSTAKVIIENNSVNVDVKLSDQYDNELTVDESGLYFNGYKYADRDDFNNLKNLYENFTNNVNIMLQVIDSQLQDIDDKVSDMVISAKIDERVSAIQEDIKAKINQVNNIQSDFDSYVQSTNQLIVERIDGIEDEITSYIMSIEKSWAYFNEPLLPIDRIEYIEDSEYFYANININIPSGVVGEDEQIYCTANKRIYPYIDEDISNSKIGIDLKENYVLCSTSDRSYFYLQVWFSEHIYPDQLTLVRVKKEIDPDDGNIHYIIKDFAVSTDFIR